MAAPYDVVREILLRVKDVTTLFRCATVCKGWRSLFVSDSSFLRRCLTEDVCRDSSPFPGFFTQRDTYTWWSPPCSVSAPCPELGNGHPLLGFSVSRVLAGYFKYAVPLASRHGLLLMRLEPHTHSTGIHPDRTGVLLAVCDLLTGTVHELPRLEHYWNFEQGHEMSGYALLTASDCSSSNDDGGGVQQHPSCFFKVLIVTVRYWARHWETRYNLHMFSSATEESGWNTCSGVVVGGEGHPIRATLRQHNAVVLGGAARWLMWGQDGTYTLDVNAKTGDVSSTKVMDIRKDDLRSRVYDKPYLTVDGEGNLTLLSVKRDGRELEISTSYDNGRSFLASTLLLRQPDQQTDGADHVYTCLGEKCGMMLVKVSHRRVYMADVKTGLMWEVPEWPRSNGLVRRKIVPWDIDWLAFFAFRLAVAP